MNVRKTSPISVEILAQCGRKFRIRLRFAVPATLVVVRFLPVIKLLG